MVLQKRNAFLIIHEFLGEESGLRALKAQDIAYKRAKEEEEEIWFSKELSSLLNGFHNKQERQWSHFQRTLIQCLNCGSN